MRCLETGTVYGRGSESVEFFEGISESMSWKKHEAGRGLEGNLYETNEA